ncbi:MAG: DUF2087 domain-containing protein [Acidimicrobiia bacterium]|nr:DUF2087 domain-containing protein [Acidimicrobiia bacterium]
MISASKLVGLMAEADRRRVVAALILSAGDLAHVVEASGVERRQAINALERLSTAGLVEVGADGIYVLLEETFKIAARAGHETRGSAVGRPASNGDVQVVERSVVDGRLVHLPRKRSKRLLVLDHLAQVFEPGARYSEREVNTALRAFDDDVAALRRYLVDEGFLDRSGGSYWRSGGTVETAS